MKRYLLAILILGAYLGTLLYSKHLLKPPQISWEEMYHDDWVARMAVTQFYESLAENLRGKALVWVNTNDNRLNKRLSLSENIDYALSNKFIEHIFEEASRAKKIARSNSFQITLVPSIRKYDETGAVQAKESLESQKRVAEIISRDKPQLIFTDSLYSHENAFAGFMRDKKMYEEYGDRYSNITNWWQLILSKTGKVNGLVSEEVDYFTTFPQEIEDLGPSLGVKDLENLTKPARTAAHHLREIIYLTRISQALEESGKTNVYVVIDDFRTNTFPRQCRRWNIGVKILER